jgi:multiple sugar transport system ATP-binding protein
MKDGLIQQVDTPLNLYDKPANLFVAGFIGSPQMNLLTGVAAEGGVKVGGFTMPVDPAVVKATNGDVVVGVRPESWRMVGAGEGLPVTVNVIEELGADAFVYGTCEAEGTPHDIIVRVHGRDATQKGAVLHVTTDPANVHVFDKETGARLSA